MDDVVYLTRGGYQKLYKEVERLKSESLKIAGQIEEARLQGDLSENAEYDAAKEAQAYTVARRQEIESTLGNVRIIEDENIPGDKIYIGAIVDLKDLDRDEEIQYQMVSPEESSYEENKLSIFAPIGKALMGHAEGEELEITVPAGILRYKIVKIQRPE